MTDSPRFSVPADAAEPVPATSVPTSAVAAATVAADSAGDRNFDDLAHRFRRNVYGGLKGDIRLAVLQRDLDQQLPALRAGTPLRILDAGGGQGQLALQLARLGHRVLVCDISAEMLALADAQIAADGLGGQMCTRQVSIQTLAAEGQQFDLVLCHAVLEWVAEPQALLADLLRLVQPAGHLSLTFFNINSIIFKNLLRSNFAKVLAGNFKGSAGSLTPTNPLQPEQVYEWLAQLPLQTCCHSGIRCFHDYILDPARQDLRPDQQLELELIYSRREPYRGLARYIHVLGQRSEPAPAGA